VRSWIPAALALLWALEWAGVSSVARHENVPAPPPLRTLATAVPSWNLAREESLDPGFAETVGADAAFSATYVRQGGVEPAQLLVAWFASQIDGRRQPHSPKVCLPGSGWFPESSGTAHVALADGASLAVNRYAVVSGNHRAVVLYWYQTPYRTLVSEWTAKLWLAPDAWRYHRTDTALVRVVTPSFSPHPDAATATAGAFIRAAFPALREALAAR
jgi:EpsI family protein